MDRLRKIGHKPVNLYDRMLNASLAESVLYEAVIRYMSDTKLSSPDLLRIEFTGISNELVPGILYPSARSWVLKRVKVWRKNRILQR